MSIQNLTNETLGQYHLRELLGIGGMGAVYRAYQTNLKREVAIKVLPTTLALQPGYVERFNREAETAAALEHPHIVPIYDYGTQRGTSYIVMRLFTGGTLAQRLAQRAGERNPLPSLGEISSLLNQLASALDYAHSMNVIHRDIKTSNVMFDNQGSAYLMDFGIARLMEATSSLTGTGLAMGTPSYMSPEQWRGDNLTAAADQYELGVLIYALVSGRLPFEAGTPYALMNKHINEQPTPLQSFRADVPEAVTTVLNRAMAKDPHQRFPTVTAFAKAFSSAIEGKHGESVGFFTFKIRPSALPGQFTPSSPSKVPSQPVATGEKPRINPMLLVGGAAGIVVIVGLILMSSLQGGDHDISARQTRVALNLTETAFVSAPDTATPTRGIISILTTDTPEASPEIPTDTLSPEPTVPAVALIADEESTVQTQTAVADMVTVTAEQAAVLLLENTDTATFTSIPSDTPTETPPPNTSTPVPTDTPQPSETPLPTATFTQIPSETPLPTNTGTPVPTATNTDTPVPTDTPSPVPTDTAVPTPTFTLTPTPTLCQRSDVNGSGTIDIFDVRPVAVLLGLTASDSDFNPNFDFDDDGDIDIFDLRHVSSQYGQTCE